MKRSDPEEKKRRNQNEAERGHDIYSSPSWEEDTSDTAVHKLFAQAFRPSHLHPEPWLLRHGVVACMSRQPLRPDVMISIGYLYGVEGGRAPGLSDDSLALMTYRSRLIINSHHGIMGEYQQPPKHNRKRKSHESGNINAKRESSPGRSYKATLNPSLAHHNPSKVQNAITVGSRG